MCRYCLCRQPTSGPRSDREPYATRALAKRATKNANKTDRFPGIAVRIAHDQLTLPVLKLLLPWRRATPAARRCFVQLILAVFLCVSSPNDGAREKNKLTDPYDLSPSVKGNAIQMGNFFRFICIRWTGRCALEMAYMNDTWSFGMAMLFVGLFSSKKTEIVNVRRVGFCALTGNVSALWTRWMATRTTISLLRRRHVHLVRIFLIKSIKKCLLMFRMATDPSTQRRHELELEWEIERETRTE